MSGIGSIGALLALLAALAFLIEAVVEILVSSWLKRVVVGEGNADLRALILRLCSSVVGVLVTMVYGLDLLSAVAQIFGVSPIAPAVAVIVGQVLTGVLLGRGSQWFHDIGVTWLGLDQIGVARDP